ncbi:hypothetical protein [Paraperlucidibaca sp.]|uniref:hypothetical protein n=1 Tax=Paraperlucidibaca sp. TaxID=2708021 RepID=UPI0030F375C6
MPITLTRNKALFAVILIMMAVLGRNIASQAADLSSANLPNPDSYYKLVILKDYTPETGFQFIARDNAPYGSWIHWSLPHTWTIWQLHRGLMAFGVEKEAALLWAGGGLTMLSMLLLALFLALAVANVGSPQAAIVSALALASSPPLFGYGQLVQITHHIFMLVPLAAAAACFLRREFRLSRWQDYIGGALLGLALWISPETMPLVLALAAMRAVIRLQHPLSGSVWPVAVGLLGILLIGWLVDPPPPTFTAWALDHISLSWLLFGGLLSCLLLHADSCVRRELPLLRSMQEQIFALVLAAMCWLLLVPDALSGPTGLIPDELRVLWYGQIKELKSVEWPSEWLAYLLLPLIAAVMLGCVAWQNRSLWMLVLAVSTLIYAVLGATHIRMGAAAAFISALAFSIGLSKIRAFISLHNSNTPLREQFLCAFLILSLPLQVYGAMGLSYFENRGFLNEGGKESESCNLSDALPVLNSIPFGTVLTNPNLGPELLFKTQHRIIAGNYHHNVSGLIDSFKLLRSIEPDKEAKALMKARDISYILSCTEVLGSLRSGRNDKALSQRIAAAEIVDWLSYREVTEDWRLYLWR